MWVGVVYSKSSDQLWLKSSLGQAEQKESPGEFLVQAKVIWIFNPAILCMTGFIQLYLMMNVAKVWYTYIYAVDNGGLGSQLRVPNRGIFRRFNIKSE